ncbi:MAG: NAD(P)-dependent oxidoreductase [Alphaproteobacteria bacterium]|nr:NAD(P)-dependent oxidoreductase [Alphaproteobacteria bacterium]MCW5739870.1 NAD(P)-dependent oxidoreductase [Alphaproteobacteria bacterium]
MGEPMCANLARKSGHQVIAFDLSTDPLARLAAHGVGRAESLAVLMRAADIVFLSLPGGRELAQVCQGEGGLLALARSGQTIVDLGTSPVPLSRDLARRFAALGVDYADSPVARTRQAAIDGTLSIMVGGGDAVFARIEKLLRAMASEVSHCGEVGAGQIAKIMNNMVLAQTVVALAEALAIARNNGMDGTRLFETLTRGSADSFALRNHGMKAMLPGVFPERAFSAEYMLKDLGYALDLAASGKVEAAGAANAAELMKRAIARGDGASYWPVIARTFGPVIPSAARDPGRS